MQELIELAETIAVNVHEDQTDLQRQPYIDHVRRVADAQETDKARVLAWLHDVVEDGGISVKTLREAGIPFGIALKAETLARKKRERYADYIERLIKTGSTSILLVKIADMKDNMRAGCPEGLLNERYKKQLPRLEAALELQKAADAK